MCECGGNEDVAHLPGTYSLACPFKEAGGPALPPSEPPDWSFNVVDASNLERNLYLTTQLIELRAPLVLRVQHERCRRGPGHSI